MQIHSLTADGAYGLNFSAPLVTAVNKAALQSFLKRVPFR